MHSNVFSIRIECLWCPFMQYYIFVVGSQAITPNLHVWQTRGMIGDFQRPVCCYCLFCYTCVWCGCSSATLYNIMMFVLQTIEHLMFLTYWLYGAQELPGRFLVCSNAQGTCRSAQKYPRGQALKFHKNITSGPKLCLLWLLNNIATMMDAVGHEQFLHTVTKRRETDLMTWSEMQIP